MRGMQDTKNNYRDYEIEETLDRGIGRPIEEPYWVPSTFGRQEVINPVTNRSRLPVKLIWIK